MSTKFQKVFAPFPTNYELIDAGGGKKLERFGDIILIRPEVQAYFKSENTFLEWNKIAHAEYIEKENKKGTWHFLQENVPEKWQINLGDLLINLEFSQFKHTGIFPEQALNWNLISEKIHFDDSFLNLFAYTGVASLYARKKGAQVTHVDSVKQLISHSKLNMESSNLSDIKWVHEDALKFAQKEVRREKKYQGIIMDPPAFGLGTKGEKWILDQKLPDLLQAASELLVKKGFLIVNTYSPKVSAENLCELANSIFVSKKIKVEELWMKSTSNKNLYFGNILSVY
jgi:23S rRNA (cytosine1962-C5)-methyltransferase